jgi:uncharacterized protein (DUF2461 family)
MGFDSSSYYLAVGPGGETMIAAGSYQPVGASLLKIRRAIADDAGPIKQALAGQAIVAVSPKFNLWLKSWILNISI